MIDEKFEHRCPKHSTKEHMVIGKSYLLDSIRCEICMNEHLEAACKEMVVLRAARKDE